MVGFVLDLMRRTPTRETQGNRVGKCRWGLLAGDETKAQLQRIYATAWESPEQLSEYKRRKEEALRRDHRRLGKELGLFILAMR